MPQSAQDATTETTGHYQWMATLARHDEQCPPLVGAGLRLRDRLKLASIATMMNVPIVIATFRDENSIQTFATHGLDLTHNLAHFAAACDSLCIDREVVIPDTRVHPCFSKLARHWPSEDICFLVGIPLRDGTGQRVGSLAVMNSSREVARSGISFRALADIGKSFSQSGQLQPKYAAI